MLFSCFRLTNQNKEKELLLASHRADIKYGIEGDKPNYIIFQELTDLILVINSQTERSIEKLFDKLGEYGLRKEIIKNLEFSNEEYISWIDSSNQILEINLILSGTQKEIKYLGFKLNHKKVKTLIQDNRVSRMMFSLELFPTYLITVRYNGKVIISPDPDPRVYLDILHFIIKKSMFHEIE